MKTRNNIKIIRSTRRRKTISAKRVGDEIHIYLPAHIPASEEKKWVDKMLGKFEKSKRRRELNKDGGYLTKRAKEINKTFFNNKLKLKSIKYVTNQSSKFGSCTPARGTIRISDKLAEMPNWVIDYVIIHELAHLIESNHSRKFWDIVNKYEYTERARGFLIAKTMEDDLID